MDLKQWLESNGLGKYAELLYDNAVGLDVLKQITEADLKELGIPLGPRPWSGSSISDARASVVIAAGSRAATTRHAL